MLDRKNYKALVQRILNDNIKYPGKVATLLLETFLRHEGQLKASTVYNKGICNAGDFKAWRNYLITKNWLCYVEGQYSTHKPGSRLIRYVNKELVSIEPVATKKDLDKLECVVSTMRGEIADLKNSVSLI